MLLEWLAGLMLVPEVTVASREVRVSDLVRTIEGRRFAGRGAEQVALRLRVPNERITLPAEAVASLVRRRVPGLSLAPSAGSVTIIGRAERRGSAHGCWSSTRALSAGEAITRTGVLPAACAAASSTLIGHDRRTGAPFARADIAAGTPLGRFQPAAGRRVAAGTRLTVRTAVGPVVVERSVVAMQAGRSGRSVFVRDGGGQVFAAPLTLAEDAR